jgi:hypothetical protein
MKVEQTSNKLIKAPNSTIQRLVNAIVGTMKINSQEIARSSVVPSVAFMVIRENKFDEFTLLDKISKINMTYALARLSASVSRGINEHLSTYGGTSNMSVHPKPRTSSAPTVTSTCSIKDTLLFFYPNEAFGLCRGTIY